MHLRTQPHSTPIAQSITGFCAAAFIAQLVPIAQAQLYVSRFSGPGGGIGEGENAIRPNPIVASGYYNVFNFQDNGGTGGPNDFGSDFNIPGDIIGTDENDWALFGSGVLHVQTTGTYVFRSGSDDSSRVIIDGRNVVAQGGCCANVDGPGIFLEAGSTHFIGIALKEGGGGGNGEFSVSRDGGAFSLFGAVGVHPDLVVNQTGFQRVASASNPGLLGSYYATAGQITVNQNRATDLFLASNPTPTGTFLSTTVNYHGGGTIAEHLAGDSGTLSNGGGNNTADALLTLSGFIEIRAADDLDPSATGIQVKFAFDADDNARLTLGGLVIVENDGGHGTGHFASGNTDLLSANTGDNASGTAVATLEEGFYSLSAYYHNGGGGIDGQILTSIGQTGGGVGSIPSDRLSQIPEPGAAGLSALGVMVLGIRRRRHS
jgi:hypothetical protein